MNSSSCRSTHSPRTQWPGQGRKNGWTLGGRSLPRADTLSLCYSNPTVPFDCTASLPVSWGSQHCWLRGCLFYYNQGPPTPANNKPEFRKQCLGYVRKGHMSRGSCSAGRHGSMHKGTSCIENVFSNCRVRWCPSPQSYFPERLKKEVQEIKGTGLSTPTRAWVLWSWPLPGK